jgi:hypothetical protein
MMINLLMGNVVYDDNAEEKNQLFFVKKTYRTNKFGKKLLNSSNEWEVIAIAEMPADGVFNAPVLQKSRISVLDKNGKILTRADQAKERIGMKDAGKMEWDDINSIALKKGVAKISYPMFNTVLAPQPCIPAELASITSVEKNWIECEVRNNINLKTLLGSSNGAFYANDTKGIDEKQLDHLRHLVRGFGVYTGARMIMFVDDGKEIPEHSYKAAEASARPKAGTDHYKWQTLFSNKESMLLEDRPPTDPAEKKSWTTELNNMVSNPIHQAFVKFTGAGVSLGYSELEENEESDYMIDLNINQILNE